MRLEAVAQGDLAAIWPRVEPWLAAACARPGCDVGAGDLRALIEDGAASLVLVLDGSDRALAVGVLQIRHHASGRAACWLLAVGGRCARAWRCLGPALETIAAGVGCGTIEFVGRTGWRRHVPSYVAAPCEAGTHFVKRIA